LITSCFPNIENPSPFHCHRRLAIFGSTKNIFFAVEEMLKQFDFEKGEGWIYDPHGVIVARNPTYKHQPNVLVERTANLESWEEVKEDPRR
jgi:hypothetical protein